MFFFFFTLKVLKTIVFIFNMEAITAYNSKNFTFLTHQFGLFNHSLIPYNIKKETMGESRYCSDFQHTLHPWIKLKLKTI